MLLEVTCKHRVNTESEAREMIDSFRAEAKDKGYIIKKAGYEHKTKKAKGEVVAECWVVTIVQIFGDVWEDLV